MNHSSHVTVRRAWSLAGEEGLLNAVTDNLTDEEVKLVYSDWLEDHGDPTRAAFLRQYVSAFRTMDVDDFPSFDDVPAEWSRMIGANLVYAIADHEAAEHRDSWLALAKPALIYSAEPSDPEPFDGADETPIGGTKFFGLPDLPPGSSWPAQRDCRALYDPDSGIEPSTPCGFVAQVAFADLVGTQFGRRCPPAGLLSVFACCEIASIGMVDGYIDFTPDGVDLVRMEPPTDLVGEFADEGNQIMGPQRLTLSETLELPYPGDSSPFPAVAFGYSDDRFDTLTDIVDVADAGHQLDSIGGYTRATTGDDPLPGPEWIKLMCVQNGLEMQLHFCIRADDLAASRFDRVQLAWVDFD